MVQSGAQSSGAAMETLFTQSELAVSDKSGVGVREVHLLLEWLLDKGL